MGAGQDLDCLDRGAVPGDGAVVVHPRALDREITTRPITPMTTPTASETNSVRNANYAQRTGAGSVCSEASARTASKAASANPS